MLLFVQFLKILDPLGDLIVDIGVGGLTAGGENRDGKADDGDENADHAEALAEASQQSEDDADGHDAVADKAEDGDRRGGEVLEIPFCFHNKSPFSEILMITTEPIINTLIIP